MFQTIPIGREERWRLMETLIASWARPLQVSDRTPVHRLDAAETRLGVRIPTALREWYLIAGEAKDVWSRQDRLLSPEDLSLQEDVLVFGVENQYVWSFGAKITDADEEDPPVYGWMDQVLDKPDEFGILSVSVSAGILQYLAWSLGMLAYAFPQDPIDPCVRRSFSDGTWKPETLAAIEQAYVRCSFPVWRLWCCDNVFYEGEDLLIHVSDSAPDYLDRRLFVAARTETAVATFEKVVAGTGFHWDTCPGERF